MDTRNTVEIKINGRRFKLTGNESTAYMQKAADHINNMYENLKAIPGFTSKSQDYQTLMMYLNLTDEYLKKSNWTEEKQMEIDTKTADEIYHLKMELVEIRKKMEARENSHKEELQTLREKLNVTSEERNRFCESDKDKTTRISVLEKELVSFKTETAILKRKTADYEKSAASVAEKLRSADDIERKYKMLKKQCENYESGVRKQVENAVNLSKKQYEAEKKDYEEIISNLKKEISDSDLKIKSFEEEISKHTEVNKELKDKIDSLNEEVSKSGDNENNVKYQLNIAESLLKEQEHDFGIQLAELKAEYENRISAMQPEYDMLMEEQESAYSTLKERYDNLQKEYDKKEDALRNEIEDLRKKIRGSDEDMVEYLDLIDEKDREIANLKLKLQEASNDL